MRGGLTGGACRVRWRGLVHDAEQWIERGGAEMLGCGEGERKVMTGGPGSAAREAGRGRRCWAERAEGESWATALGLVRERVGRAGRGKGGLGRPGLGWAGVLGSSPIGFSFLSYSFPFLFETPLKLFEFKSNLNSTPMHSTK